MIRVITLLILLTSCASARSSWEPCGVALEKRVWRYCHPSKGDPEAYFEKGVCYRAKLCKKRFLMKPKVKVEQLYCAFGDVECFRRNKWPAVRRGGDVR